MSVLQTAQKNINLATVENCNLLCKLILDYLDTKTCTIQKIDGESFRIVYPEGSFINYRDTSYELTYAYFFYPSRHSIDGEKYDLEVNIYHGKFVNSDSTERGMVTHTHYHLDMSTDSRPINQHKHFHYHLPDDTQNDVHSVTETNHINKNLVTCLLFNKGQHVGSDVNIFFNQFIHHPEFKKITTHPNEKEISVHENWTIEQIYPKKRSFFMYDDPTSNDTKNTIVVFDTIQTISKEIIDRLYKRGIKDVREYDISNYEMSFTTPDRVLYRKNIEVITDAAYKKSKRAQIKDLLSLTRMSAYKPMQRTSKEYFYFGEGIKQTYSGGENTDFYNSHDKAKRLAGLWEEYGEDVPMEIEAQSLVAGEKINFNSQVAQTYNYVNLITRFEVSSEVNIPNNITDTQEKINYFHIDKQNEYLKARKSLSKLFTRWYSSTMRIDHKEVSILGNENFSNLELIELQDLSSYSNFRTNYYNGAPYNGIDNNPKYNFLFFRMYFFFKILVAKILFARNDENKNPDTIFFQKGISQLSGYGLNTHQHHILKLKDSMHFTKLIEYVHSIVNTHQNRINSIQGNTVISNEVFNNPVPFEHNDYFSNSDYGDLYKNPDFTDRLINPTSYTNSDYPDMKTALGNNGINNFEDIQDLFEDLYNVRHLLCQLSMTSNYNRDPHGNYLKYFRALQLRVLFEDIDTKFQRDNNFRSNIYSTLSSLFNQNYGINECFLSQLTQTKIGNNPDHFKDIITEYKYIFQKNGQKMTRTLSNEKCQNWLSHETHYEGELWKFWKKPPKMEKDDSIPWDNLSPELKQTIKDGLLTFDETEGKWKTHNQCRNPGNRSAGPWCYTTNPNKRWEYCQKPYYSDVLGKFVLFLVFIFIAVIAFFTIKTLFLHEYPMKFVAKLTGGDFATKGTFTKGQGAGVAPTK